MFGSVVVGRCPSLGLVDDLSPRHICVALIRFSEFLKRKRVGYEVGMVIYGGEEIWGSCKGRNGGLKVIISDSY